MPKLSKEETLDVPVIQTGEVVGRQPFFLLGSNYGIATDSLSYVLVKRKPSVRYVRDNNGNVVQGESVDRWTDLGYTGTFSAALELFYEQKVHDDFSNLKGPKSYKELMKIQADVMSIIREATNDAENVKGAFTIGDTAELKRKLENDLNEISALKSKVEQESENLLNLIKEKRSIILKETEPKKHRIKIEK